MTTILFQPRFAELVKAGTKVQTIRPVRKRRIPEGDILSLRRWSGAPYRSKQIVLREARLLAVLPVRMALSWIEFNTMRLKLSEEHTFAMADGFSGIQEMLSWFDVNHGLPFTGELIVWTRN